ncbi:MAG: class I SAM-dependent methyltransferase [Isosphaeraceae bacterium]
MQSEYAQAYRTLWERHWWWRSREAYVLSWVEHVRRLNRGPVRTLDVGCGDGLFFDRLSEFGPVDGLEPDASLVTNPRWRGRIRVGALGTGDPLAREASDLVLLLDVIEHIRDERAAAGRRPFGVAAGGHAIVTVPALSWLWSRHDEVNEHHRRHDARSLRESLNGAGFRVEAVRYFFAWTVGRSC